VNPDLHKEDFIKPLSIYQA
jgi:hypothetical protein